MIIFVIHELQIAQNTYKYFALLIYRNTITAQCFKYYLLHKRITVLISNGHYSTPFVEEIISNCFNLLPIMTIVDRDAAITITEANIILV